MPERREGHFLPFLGAWRRKKFMNQVELAKVSGVSHSTIKYLEHEDQPHPANLSTIAKLAKALGIDPETLVTVDPGAVGMAPPSQESTAS